MTGCCPRGEQSLYASLSLSQADSYWDDRRELQQDSCTSRDWRATLHYEYGYSYYRTLFASTAFERNQCGTESAVGVPDVKLGMRGRVDPFRNGYTWELAAIIPVNGDRLDRRKPGSGLFGIEAGLFRSYRDDPYEKPFTEVTQGVWGWGIGVTLWAEGAGRELWGELNWRRRLSDDGVSRPGSAATTPSAETAPARTISSAAASRSITTSLRLAPGFTRKLTRDTSLGLALEQALWGRNTSQDTTLKLEFSQSWD